MATETTKLTYVEGAAAATPAASRVVTYAKADGLMYSKDDAGTETLMSGGAGGGSVATDAIWDEAGDTVVGTGANTAVRRKNNDGAAVAPAVTDDSGDGYSVGSRWIDTTADKEYVCLDASVGAAVWTETTGAGGSSGFVDSASVRLSAGDKTLNSTSWATVDAALDLVVTAATGDVITASLSGMWESGGTYAFLDVATWVSAAGVNWFGSGEGAASSGVTGWFYPVVAISPLSGSVDYVVQAGDISGGTVTLRLRYRTATAANVVVRANADNLLFFQARVFRP